MFRPGKMTAAHSPLSSSPSSSTTSGFRFITYHDPTAIAIITMINIASETGSVENPIVRGPAAISPFGPGSEVSDILTLTSIRVGGIPYREGREWFAISAPVTLRSGLVSIGHTCRVSLGTTALATGNASNTRMKNTDAYFLTQTTSH
jgi:hypothetical protein